MPHSTIEQRESTIDQDFDVASLQTINFQRLVDKEADEVAKLLNAAQNPGFFYLDLKNDGSNDFLKELQDVYAISAKFFKPTEDQAMFEISRDKANKDSLSFPAPLDEHAETLKHFSSLCDEVNKEVLARLSDALHLQDASRFENFHREDEPSDTALNLIYSPAKPKRADAPDTTHTDTGTLTSLFCDDWGIMIEDPETKSWAFAEPRPGCALVNIADSLQRLSGDRLRSCRHCHTQPADGFKKRYFVVAYLRPEKGS